MAEEKKSFEAELFTIGVLIGFCVSIMYNKMEFTEEEWKQINLCVEDKANQSSNYELQKLSNKIREYRWLKFYKKYI